ncbi:MAG: hypothetical protein ABI779_14150 [Acidobacteriota bacterium]
MEWLNANSGGINALLTSILTVATLSYVVLTARLVRENIAIRELTSRPVLSITPALSDVGLNFVNLLLENWGNGPALHVKFEVTQPVVRHGITDLSKVGFFGRGLAYLGPHQRFELFLASSIGNLDELKKVPIEIDVNYQDEAGRRYSQKFKIDFAELEGITRIGEPPLQAAAKSLKKIEQSLDGLARGSYRPSVTVHTLEDLEREGRVSELWFKLNELDAASWKEVEELVDARSAKSSGGEGPAV